MQRLGFTFLAAALAAVGCSQTAPQPVEVHPVSGQILYDGKPAAGVRVTFVPIDAPSPPRVPNYPHAVTDAEGKFRLTTAAPDDGAAAGGYQIVLDGSKQNNAENVGSEESADTDLFKGWYDAMHSTLTAKVKPGANELPVLKLPKVTQPAGVSEGVPGRN